MEKIIFVSPFRGECHFRFEAYIIEIIMDIFPKKEYIFIGDEKHILRTLSCVKNSNKIKTIMSKSGKGNRCLFFIFRKVFFIKKAYTIYLENPFYHSYIFWLFFILKIDIIFMHSYWKRWPDKKKKIFYLLTLKILNIIRKKIKILVLGEWIYNNIQKDTLLSRRDKNKFHWINHPGLRVKNVDNIKSKKVCFGFIGNQKHPQKFINSTTLSKVKESIVNLGGKVISYEEKFLEEDTYIKSIQESDYIIFLSPGKSYDYACSGIFIDAVCYHKPIICIAGGMTDFFFEKYGNIGFKFNNEKQLIENIEKIINIHPEIYRHQVKNLKKTSLIFHSHHVRKNLKKIITG